MLATEAFEKVRESVESIANDAPQGFPEAASIGDWHRQGDIQITKSEKMTGLKPSKTNQLAPGNSKGSRHLADGDIIVYERSGDALTGPYLEVGEKGGRVSHPEHGDCILPPNSCYVISYQRMMAEEIKRAID